MSVLDEKYNLVFLVPKKPRFLEVHRLRHKSCSVGFCWRFCALSPSYSRVLQLFYPVCQVWKGFWQGISKVQCNRTIRAMKANLRRKIPRKYFQFRTFQFPLQGRGQSPAGSEVSTSLLNTNCKMSILDYSSIFANKCVLKSCDHSIEISTLFRSNHD